jgi:hypothetical protein
MTDGEGRITTMSEKEYEIQDMAMILDGYENWKSTRNPMYQKLDVSTYLDELATQRAVDAIEAIREIYNDPELSWPEIDAEIRRILGVHV